jgi:hypothetical protein
MKLNPRNTRPLVAIRQSQPKRTSLGVVNPFRRGIFVELGARAQHEILVRKRDDLLLWPVYHRTPYLGFFIAKLGFVTK